MDPSRDMEISLEYCIINTLVEARKSKYTQERWDHMQDELEKVEVGYRE